MAEQNTERPPLPDHIEETIRAINLLRAQHEESGGAAHRLVGTITQRVGTPVFVSSLAVFVTAWIVLNLGLSASNLPPPDPPPFQLLNVVVSLLSLFVVLVVLATQRRYEEFTLLHQQLTLQLALIAEQKAAKLIALLESLRKDHPGLPDRVDKQAEAMAQPANPETVLDAIKATRS